MQKHNSTIDTSTERFRLVDSAKKYGIDFEAHDALNDARATALCYKAMLQEKKG